MKQFKTLLLTIWGIVFFSFLLCGSILTYFNSQHATIVWVLAFGVFAAGAAFISSNGKWK